MRPSGSARDGGGVRDEQKQPVRRITRRDHLPRKPPTTPTTDACTMAVTRPTGCSDLPVPRQKPKRPRPAFFLREHLTLELSEDKTPITHAASTAARFRGDERSSVHADDTRAARGRRRVNGHIMLKVPWDVITSLSSRYERRGKPDACPPMPDDDAFSIIGRYGVELRGYVNSDALAHSVGTL